MVANLVRQIPIIAEHAQAIGYVCVLWAAMEVSLDRLLETVVPFEPAHISDSITANVDLHEKLRALNAVAFNPKPRETWLAEVERWANYVYDTLRPARNRYVHDLRMAGTAGISKRTRRTLITHGALSTK